MTVRNYAGSKEPSHQSVGGVVFSAGEVKLLAIIREKGLLTDPELAAELQVAKTTVDSRFDSIALKLNRAGVPRMSGRGKRNRIATWLRDNAVEPSSALFSKTDDRARKSETRAEELQGDPAALSTYLEALRIYCCDVPSWFPERLGFAQALQQVSVTPPSSRASEIEELDGSAEQGTQESDQAGDNAGPGRRVTLEGALRQYQRLVVVGDPGTGKSWAVRGLALSVADSLVPGVQPAGTLIPLLVLAPLLEDALEEMDLATVTHMQLVSTFIRALPLPVSARLTENERRALVDLVSDGRSILLLIDGYDEIRSDQQLVSRALPTIEGFCLATQSRFVLTTRPSSMPPRGGTSFGWCTLEFFGNREQHILIQRWFNDDPVSTRRLTSWVREHHLDIMQIPLMLSLFCSISERGGEPPSTEQELWERALLRLASEEGRFAEVREDSERARLRLRVLQLVAATFVGEGLREAVPASVIEDELHLTHEWRALEREISASVMDDLLNTGIVQKTTGVNPDLEFLHSSFRDYLIAVTLARQEDWHDKLHLLWSHAEWEPVIGYLGALVTEPNELLTQLIGLFGDDSLNIARLVAGRVLSAAADDRVHPELAIRVRNELLILLASTESWDRIRAGRTLSSTRVPGTTTMLQALLNPSTPTYVIVAAIDALAGSLNTAVSDALQGVVRTNHFTPEERQAAVFAIADSATDDALVKISDYAGDSSLPDGVRVAAAIAGWDVFNESEIAIRILASDDEKPSVQRLLSERLVVEPSKANEISALIASQRLHVQDNYARSVLISVAASLRDEMIDGVLDCLPMNPVLERLWQVADYVSEHVEDNPTLATFARFITSSSPPRARWMAAERLGEGSCLSPLAVWNDLIERATPEDAGLFAQFLASELASGPQNIQDALRRELEGLEPHPLILHAFKRREDSYRAVDSLSATNLATAPLNQAEDVQENSTQALPSESLVEALNSDLPPLLRYGLLRHLRAQLPLEGTLRDRAVNLTHQVTVEAATTWIDAVPDVAPTVEARLLAAGSNSLVELTRLRSHWPGRGSEVVYSSKEFDAQVLDAKAEAAVADGDLASASVLALASLGVSSIDGKDPSRTAISVLYSSGHATGRGASVWNMIRGYHEGLTRGTLDWRLLASWLYIGTDLSLPGRLLGDLPGWLKAGNAEVSGLLLASGLTDITGLDLIISWSGCRRVRALLHAALQYVKSASAKATLELAIAAFDDRANLLSTLWPTPVLASPSQAGKPAGHWNLVTIAAKRLEADDAASAVAIMEDVCAEEKTDPELRNNLGFCRLALDTAAALEDLEAAFRLFGRPFDVNSANRMLANFRLERYSRVLEIGEESVSVRVPEGIAWLWDIDATSPLRNNVDVLLYIIDLAERAAIITGRKDDERKWRNRRVAWRPNTPPEETTDDGF